MSPRHILLHVGHGKTGSSFLQSAMANSIDILADHGIAYPLGPDERERVRAGEISSGNITASPRRLARMLERGDDRLLLSSEALFNKMRPNGFMDKLRRREPELKVDALVYIRDPLDHAVSKYQQSIKRQGSTENFETFLASYNQPAKVVQFITWLETFDVTVTLRNYSRHRDDLLDTLGAWLGLEPGTLIPPPMAQVNRSMTNAEIAIQKAFNQHFGADSARFVSDPLCERLPEIRSERPPASPEVLSGFLERMTRMIANHELVRCIPADESYRVATLEDAQARFARPDPGANFTFSSDQLRVLAESILARLDPTLASAGPIRLKKEKDHPETAAKRQGAAGRAQGQKRAGGKLHISPEERAARRKARRAPD
jgi:hypothetical protein